MSIRFQELSFPQVHSHGLPFGLGKALALKTNNINSNVYVLIGDGELEKVQT